MNIKWTKWLIFPFVIVVGMVVFSFFWRIPPSPQIISIYSHTQTSHQDCYTNMTQTPIDNNGEFSVFVWNMYKQNKTGWQQELDKYQQQAQLLMMQEAYLDDELVQWLQNSLRFADQVSAFEHNEISSGVLNIAQVQPQKVCAYTYAEPWLRLPKSALFAIYPLSNGDTLWVINVHSINFTLGVEDYSKQVEILEKVVSKHQGPLIIAGDFNTWNEPRLNQVEAVMAKLSLQHVTFTQDHRKRVFNGLALDHIFYRGLRLKKASAPISSASDHNPMFATFQLVDYGDK